MANAATRTTDPLPDDKSVALPTMSMRPTLVEDSPRQETSTIPPAIGGFRFWSVFLSLCLLGLSTSLEATITTIALPTIIKSIDIGSQFVWVGSAFLLASTVVQPLVGQIADIFGRRWPLIGLTGLFVLGSGVAGGSTNVGMLVGGRTVQGLGAGGILVLIDVIVSDLVPLQQRGKFLGLVRISGAVGSSVGPIIGGALAQADWRWCFYLNLVTGGLALVSLSLFLDLQHHPEPTWKLSLKRIDYFGLALFMPSVTSLLLGLVLGGNTFSWNSANVIVPIVLGAVGWAVFHVYESLGLCKEPVVPGHLFTTRTSSAGFFMAFDGALLLYYVIWYLPIYFQGVLGSSPLRSGVRQLPLNLFLVPAGIVAGGTISKTGKYKPQHFVGFGLISIGVGLFTLLRPSSGTAAWACFQIITALGLGVVLTAVLPAIQAALTERDVAKSTATYAFARSFGGVWGVTIPSVIFNGQINHFLGAIDSQSVRQALANGGAYGLASRGYVQSLAEPVRSQVVGVYSDALRTVWRVAIAFALAGFLVVFAEKQYDMSRQGESKFGLKDGESKKKTGDAEAGKAAHDNRQALGADGNGGEKVET